MSEAQKPKSGFLGSVVEFGEMIKISHTLFAMPFALGSVFLAISLKNAQSFPSIWTPILQVAIAVAFARTAAMAFNRWADRDIDSHNPRTSQRSIPAGRLTSAQVLAATALSTIGFVLTCAWISTEALWLSPVVLLIVLGYSYTKRVTWLCHAVLGAGLGLAPIGAWLVVSGEIGNPIPWILGAAVLFWSTGFDIVYSCQDVNVDRSQSLNSIPARFGVSTALVISRCCHLIMVSLLGLLCFELKLPLPLMVATILTALLLFWGHLLVRSEYRKIGRIENALLEFNIAISSIFLISMIIEVLLS
ncbi:MAG: hypothetical protein CBC13_10030 [Planctomycetia bacterium TMED53]|nr:MAG: hypothetical protein CBC13_10030 [Planctomycetia bacterium TMED53]